ncbi:hypothetical protein B0H16DRAFT_1744573 [Mycena metata]|uniref:Uncharacterized protein n=1 Tax=Mycena metata TaxID=1033252 RepID=A0AAD7H4S9_9AGAR|nr:hypothetical protein B0H16DRAFT_1744573 [Mycena metata]
MARIMLRRLASTLQAPFFNPIVRVWSLRLLVWWTILQIVLWGGQWYPSWWYQAPLWNDLELAVLCGNALSIFRWPFKHLAIIDLQLNLLEITVMVVISCEEALPDIFFVELYEFFIPLTRIPNILRGIELAGLIILALLRIATIVKSDEKVFQQRVAFLGACTPAYPPYTPLRILLNRSTTRPLVRGESRSIVFARALIIWCIALGLPAFALYSIGLKPLTPNIYTQYLSPFADSPLQQLDTPSGNVTLSLIQLDGFSPAPYSDVQANISTWYGNACYANHDIISGTISGTVPVTGLTSQTFSISLRIPFGTAILITPVQSGLVVGLGSFYTAALSGGVTLFPGSHLGATFTWTKRDVISSVTWGVSNRRTTIFTPDIIGSQPFQNPSPISPKVAPYATRYLIDMVDTTVFNGISTFGGLWTFLNGAFSLFFGANILYFALGRRPLSALGIVHIFQRRRLERQWHEDFPALRTEGGLPGSESAGIVAFIRERLVDLGEDPDQPDDVEAQKHLDAGEPKDRAEPMASGRIPNSPTHELGYIPDEIPLLHVDLGLSVGEMLPPMSNATP